MDIWGVEGVEAEAELLSAIVTSFKDMGITADDVGLKVNSRKLLTGLMASLGVPEDKFAPTCVLVDKLEKVPLEAIQGDLEALGLTKEIVLTLVEALKVSYELVEGTLWACNNGCRWSGNIPQSSAYRTDDLIASCCLRTNAFPSYICTSIPCIIIIVSSYS
jgi:hypothetical protein